VLSRWLNRRRLLAIPRTEISHAPRRGLIRIVGTVAGGNTHRAPITGVSCAAFVTELFEHAGGPSLLVRKASPGFLYIDDATGRARIAPWQRELQLSSSVYRGHFDDARRAIERLLAEAQVSAYNNTGSVRGISFCEHVLREGDRVTATGCAHKVVAEQARRGLVAGYRDVMTEIELAAQPGDEVVISDDPRRLEGASHGR